MGSRPAVGGGRWVDVAPQRLSRWIDGFAARHGQWTAVGRPYGIELSAPDGARAELHAPPGVPPAPDLATLLAAVAADDRRTGLLLARKGAVAVGVAEGDRLVASKVETHYVQGRTAAGGWSQQRFARRRDNQAKSAAAHGAGIVGRLLLPQASRLSAVVTGGDRRAIDAILADGSLGPVAALRAERVLDVPEPRHAVLVAAVAAARAVRILVRDPAPAPDAAPTADAGPVTGPGVDG